MCVSARQGRASWYPRPDSNWGYRLERQGLSTAFSQVRVGLVLALLRLGHR